jgi:DNA invertase Pin-like site-specific DNA recombinase
MQSTNQQSKHAVAYLRVSGVSQIDGDGFDRQLEAITKYCTANGLELIKVYRELGVTGKVESLQRPALLDIFEDCTDAEDKPIILIEKLDRLARDVVIQENIIRDVRNHGLTLISAMEPDLLQHDFTRKFMRQVFGALAEYEREMIVAKLRSAKHRLKAKGQRVDGPAPYGELPGEIGVITRMKELRDTGKSFDAVADALSIEGIPTRNGGVWQGRVINRILSRAVSA